MSPKTRLTLLILLALTSAGAILWVWIDQRALLWPALLGTVPLIKKLFAWKTWVVILKKSPWILAGGLKKYVIKVVGSVTTMHVGLRFPWVQERLNTLKQHAHKLLAKLQAQWHSMGFIEKGLLALFSITLLLLGLVLIVLSKSLQLLTLRKGGESTAEQLIKRSVPKSVNKKLAELSDQAPEGKQEKDQEPPPA